MRCRLGARARWWLRGRALGVRRHPPHWRCAAVLGWRGHPWGRTTRAISVPSRQKHQRGPELHAKTAAQALAGAVFHLDVDHIRPVAQGLLDEGLGALAVAAPGCAEFEHGGAGQAVHLGAGGGLCKVLGGVGHRCEDFCRNAKRSIVLRFTRSACKRRVPGQGRRARAAPQRGRRPPLGEGAKRHRGVK
jgi:hypothetical protein